MSATKEQVPTAKAVGRSIDEFKKSHDKSFIIPNKIRTALAQLGDGWEYEMQFAKLAGVGLPDLSAYRPMFEAYLVELGNNTTGRGKRVWAGTTAAAKKMREMVS